jgi:rod shape-determining protein MreC
VSYRDGPFNDLKVPLTWTAAVAVIVAAVVAIALLLSDRRETLQTQAYGVGRRVFDAADKPVSGVLSMPARWMRELSDLTRGYLFAVSENEQLHQEVAQLSQWRDKSVALQNENARLRAVLGLRTEPPIPMVSARVVLDSRGPFANTRLADVGTEKGIKVGNPVMSERGLVGRVVGVTHGASRVLLLTDVASRTPVLINRTDARAILMGDGGANPKMAYLRGQDPVKEGDVVLTSGDGGVFPRGLPVGVAAKGLDGQWRVRLDADLSAIDFVRILEFQDFTALVNEQGLEASAMPQGNLTASANPQVVSVAGAGAPPTSSAPPASSSLAATSAPATAGAKSAGPSKPAAKPHGLAALKDKLKTMFGGASDSQHPESSAKPAREAGQ